MTGDRKDPRRRPADPAGTRPKFDPESLRPEPEPPAIDAEAYEEADFRRDAERDAEREPDRLPEVREPAAVGAAEVPRETKHTPRFQFLLGALLAVGAVAMAAAAALLLQPEPKEIDPAAGWSTWRPVTANPVDEIAKHVEKEYRLPHGRQLVLITEAGPLAFRDIPAQVVLEEPGGDLQLVKGAPILYRLCGGSGDQCSIPGKPSRTRMLLLRREALELALYTFRYVAGVDQVVVLLPGAPGQRGVSLLFRKQSLIPQLIRPLHATLSRRTPTVAGVRTSPDATLVQRLTQPIYSPGLTQNGVSGLLLVLKPIEAAATSAGQAQGPAQTQTQTQTPAQSGSSGSGSAADAGTADPGRTDDGLIIP